ncbi:MAG: phenylacetate-CoA oxygenase subunit PaaJ [Ilumatobacter sp.]|nr:phenylacetate-CoA oxygenase subunit PaaJ [Ilumatobacter sp.]
MSSVPATTVVDQVRRAVASVDDPEYPGVSIADLGLVETIEVEDGSDGPVAVVGLIPTFSGCPALDMIATDVQHAVTALTDVRDCDVRWLSGPVWSTARMSPAATASLADQYTVVLRRKDGGLRCPVCGSDDVAVQSDAGPTRCRAIAWCASCRNPVEVMR